MYKIDRREKRKPKPLKKKETNGKIFNSLGIST